MELLYDFDRLYIMPIYLRLPVVDQPLGQGDKVIGNWDAIIENALMISNVFRKWIF